MWKSFFAPVSILIRIHTTTKKQLVARQSPLVVSWLTPLKLADRSKVILESREWPAACAAVQQLVLGSCVTDTREYFCRSYGSRTPVAKHSWAKATGNFCSRQPEDVSGGPFLLCSSPAFKRTKVQRSQILKKKKCFSHSNVKLATGNVKGIQTPPSQMGSVDFMDCGLKCSFCDHAFKIRLIGKILRPAAGGGDVIWGTTH